MHGSIGQGAQVMLDNGVSVTAGAGNIFTDPTAGGKAVQFVDAQVIFQPETPAENIYYIQRGQVRMYAVGANESCRLIEILGTGQWFGSAALAGAPMHRMRAVAVGNATIIQVRVEHLLAALSHNPAQLIELNRQLAVKLQATIEDASRFVFEDCNERLLNALVRFSQSAASTQRDDGVVLRITHDQLAQAIGVARETVSVALTQFRQQNLLKTGRNQLIFNPDAVKQFAARYSETRTPYLVPTV